MFRMEPNPAYGFLSPRRGPRCNSPIRHRFPRNATPKRMTMKRSHACATSPRYTDLLSWQPGSLLPQHAEAMSASPGSPYFREGMVWEPGYLVPRQCRGHVPNIPHSPRVTSNPPAVPKRLLQDHGVELSRRLCEASRTAETQLEPSTSAEEYLVPTVPGPALPPRTSRTKSRQTPKNGTEKCDVIKTGESDRTITSSADERAVQDKKYPAPSLHGSPPKYLTAGVDPVYTDQLIWQVAKMTQTDSTAQAYWKDVSHNDSGLYDTSRLDGIVESKVVSPVSEKEAMVTREEEIDSLLCGTSAPKPSSAASVGCHSLVNKCISGSSERCSSKTNWQTQRRDKTELNTTDLSRVRQIMSQIITDLQHEKALTVRNAPPHSPNDGHQTKKAQVQPSMVKVYPSVTDHHGVLSDDWTKENVHTRIEGSAWAHPASRYEPERRCIQQDITSRSLGQHSAQGFESHQMASVQEDTSLREAITHIVYETMKYCKNQNESSPENTVHRELDCRHSKADLNYSFDSNAYDSGHGSSAYSEFNDSFSEPPLERNMTDCAMSANRNEPIYETIPEFIDGVADEHSYHRKAFSSTCCDPLDNTYECIRDDIGEVVMPTPPALPARNYPRAIKTKPAHVAKKHKVKDTPHYDDIVKDTDIVDMTSQHIYTVRDVLDSIARLAGDLPDEGEAEEAFDLNLPLSRPKIVPCSNIEQLKTDGCKYPDMSRSHSLGSNLNDTNNNMAKPVRFQENRTTQIQNHHSQRNMSNIAPQQFSRVQPVWNNSLLSAEGTFC